MPRLRILSVLCTLASLIALVALPAAASARGCAYADTPVTAAPRQAVKTAVVCLLNEQRRAHGLPALRQNDRLDRSAQTWTDTMVNSSAFSHGTDFAARISAVGFHWSAAGENIATGFTTARDVVTAWMDSAGHCRNILTPNFSAVGTGVVADAVSHFTGHNSPTWTQDFALPLGASAPSSNWAPANGCPYRI